MLILVVGKLRFLIWHRRRSSKTELTSIHLQGIQFFAIYMTRQVLHLHLFLHREAMFLLTFGNIWCAVWHCRPSCGLGSTSRHALSLTTSCLLHHKHTEPEPNRDTHLVSSEGKKCKVAQSSWSNEHIMPLTHTVCKLPAKKHESVACLASKTVQISDSQQSSFKACAQVWARWSEGALYTVLLTYRLPLQNDAGS